MKKIFISSLVALLCIFALSMNVMADNDKPITVNQLPAAAKTVVNTYFKGKKVALAKQESGLIEKSYDVVFTNGDKVEFDRKGNWKEIECKGSSVPAKLVPAAIKKYVNTNYAGNRIIKIEKDRTEYDVELSNGIEITFNKNFQVIDID